MENLLPPLPKTPTSKDFDRFAWGLRSLFEKPQNDGIVQGGCLWLFLVVVIVALIVGRG